MSKPAEHTRRRKTTHSSALRPRRIPKSKPISPVPARMPTVGKVAPATTPKGPAGKLGIVVEMLARPEGATIAQISAATGWQAHSVRGAFAGALKKKHGVVIVSEAAEGGRVYRLAKSGT